MHPFTSHPITYKGGTGPYSYNWDDGTTGSSTTLEICPEPYKEVAYSLSGGVRDHSDGNHVSRKLEIYVTHSNPDYACSTCAK